MRRLFSLLIVLSVVLVLTGCGATMNLSREGRVYGGVMFDTEYARYAYYHMSHEKRVTKWVGVPLILLCVVDLPMSFAVDTLTLPYTIFAPTPVRHHESDRKISAQPDQ